MKMSKKIFKKQLDFFGTRGYNEKRKKEDVMIQDLHAHTYYSFDSADSVETVIETAIYSGVGLLGISDHNYGVGYGRKDLCYGRGPSPEADYGSTLLRYYDHIKASAARYRNRIKVLCGLEISTRVCADAYALPPSADVSLFDYCLIENLDEENSIANGDIFSFAKRCGCPAGIAHTDLFGFLARRGEDPNRYFRRLAEENIFWEINVNLDSLHSFRTHAYVTEFFRNKRQQEIVRNAGVKLSVGFDSHVAREYKADRVKTANQLIRGMGIRLAFDGIE